MANLRGFFIAFRGLCEFRSIHYDENEFVKQYVEPPKQKKIPASTTALKVCADPNNLPFSNEKGEGFENKIAELVGQGNESSG